MVNMLRFFGNRNRNDSLTGTGTGKDDVNESKVSIAEDNGSAGDNVFITYESAVETDADSDTDPSYNGNDDCSSIHEKKDAKTVFSANEDVHRIEEPWSSEGERLIYMWLREIHTHQIKHEKAGYYYKKRRVIWGLPSILLPSIMAPVTSVLSTWKFVSYLNMSAFVFVAIFSGVDSFFSFGLRRERHFNQATRYAQLHSEIFVEMVKKRRFRVQADVFFTRIQMKYNMLNANSPVLPHNINKLVVPYPHEHKIAQKEYPKNK